MRIKKQRKQELEQELIECATRLMEISKEIQKSIHLDTTYNNNPLFKENEKVTISLSLHGTTEDGKKRTFARACGRVGEDAEALREIMEKRPEYYTW